MAKTKKNSESNSSSKEIPQETTESLANGLITKPIEVDYPMVSKKNFKKRMKNYYKSLEAMGIKRGSGNRQD